MAFVPASNTAMVEVRMSLDGQQIENTLYFQKETALVTLDLINLAQDISDWWQSSYAPLVSESLKLLEIYLVDLTTAISDSYTFPVLPSAQGGKVGKALPNNVALTVAFSTSNRGRSARGRNYISGIVESDVANNRVSQAYADSWAQAYSELIPLAVNRDLAWNVVSRFTNGAERPFAVQYLVRSARVRDLVVDSQRRRLPGRGT